MEQLAMIKELIEALETTGHACTDNASLAFDICEWSNGEIYWEDEDNYDEDGVNFPIYHLWSKKVRPWE